MEPTRTGEPTPTLDQVVVVPTAAGMTALGRRLASLLRAGDLIVLSGELGAGKTTLTRGIGAGLNVRGEVTSPTFVLAREHPPLDAGPGLVHVDAYRMGSPAEVDDLDLDASIAASVTVVEWGTGLVEGLTPDRLEIELTRPHGLDGAATGDGDPAGLGHGDEPRRVRLTGHGPRWAGVRVPEEAP